MDRRQFLGLTGLAVGAAGAAPAWAGRLAAAAASDPRLKELARAIDGSVVAPGSAAYEQARLVESTRFDAIHPHAVVYCANAGDVATAMRWARKHAIHVVPRSGGHSYGGYSTTSGVVLDVSRLNAVKVAPGAKTAVIGAGAQLIDVYSKLFAHGVTIPAGSCATVGIAGLALGGGVGFTRASLRPDLRQRERLQIVTAAGQRLTCDASHHSDLFWACRGGGGGNFGVATSFTFRDHPVSTVATYSIEWPWAQALQAVAGLAAVRAALRPTSCSPSATCSSTDPGPATARAHVVSSGQFFGTEAHLPALITAARRTPGTPLNVVDEDAHLHRRGALLGRAAAARPSASAT